MTPKGGDVRVCRNRQARPGDVKLGDSIAVNGVCLTAVELPGNGFGPTSAAKPSTAPP
jgi:riboflavin synthase